MTPEKTPTKLWITKYALTKGVEEREGVPSRHGGWRVQYCLHRRWKDDRFFDEKDAHTTREAAIARAEKMRLTRIESLTTQIEKLERLNFNPAA